LSKKKKIILDIQTVKTSKASKKKKIEPQPVRKTKNPNKESWSKLINIINSN